ncbi:MAG: hypothetical protein ACI9OD_000145 [Limisphaerales bacterium]|jgi:hypothetical protein
MNRADGVIVILLVWQLLILLVQFPLPPIRKLINRFPLNLFPRWSVFLGPQTHLRLSYREKNTTGQIGEWIQISSSAPRHWWSFFCNPAWYSDFGFRCLMLQLLRRYEGYSKFDGAIDELMWFQALKNCVAQQTDGMRTSEFQFRIHRDFGYFDGREPMEAFRSGYLRR